MIPILFTIIVILVIYLIIHCIQYFKELYDNRDDLS